MHLRRRIEFKPTTLMLMRNCLADCTLSCVNELYNVHVLLCHPNVVAEICGQVRTLVILICGILLSAALPFSRLAANRLYPGSSPDRVQPTVQWTQVSFRCSCPCVAKTVSKRPLSTSRRDDCNAQALCLIASQTVRHGILGS